MATYGPDQLYDYDTDGTSIILNVDKALRQQNGYQMNKRSESSSDNFETLVNDIENEAKNTEEEILDIEDKLAELRRMTEENEDTQITEDYVDYETPTEFIIEEENINDDEGNFPDELLEIEEIDNQEDEDYDEDPDDLDYGDSEDYDDDDEEEKELINDIQNKINLIKNEELLQKNLNKIIDIERLKQLPKGDVEIQYDIKYEGLNDDSPSLTELEASIEEYPFIDDSLVDDYSESEDEDMEDDYYGDDDGEELLLNNIDYEDYDPELDTELYKIYSAESIPAENDYLSPFYLDEDVDSPLPGDFSEQIIFEKPAGQNGNKEEIKISKTLQKGWGNLGSELGPESNDMKFASSSYSLFSVYLLAILSVCVLSCSFLFCKRKYNKMKEDSDFKQKYDKLVKIAEGKFISKNKKEKSESGDQNNNQNNKNDDIYADQQDVDVDSNDTTRLLIDDENNNRSNSRTSNHSDGTSGNSSLPNSLSNSKRNSFSLEGKAEFLV